MTITSFAFFCFLTVIFIAYYICPHKYRWIMLLAFSVAFYALSAPLYTLGYWAAAALVTYAAGRILENRKSKVIFAGSICVIISFLAILKYLDFIQLNISYLGRVIGANWNFAPIKLVASLGISYYSLQLIGYICDVYWGTIKPQTNLFKLCLFGCYFPQMISGPICRYEEIEKDLYGGNTPDYSHFVGGLIRIVWGLFKKLVVSGRLGMFVNEIYNSPENYSAIYIWLAAFGFALQLFADFSGCMDIMLGASECLGIRMPENFNSPFLSQGIQEFWQRWHISLGTWFKTYVMYPFLNSKRMIKVEERFKSLFGKKRGRRYTSYLGMLLVWIGIGVWHGSGWKFIIGEGLWFWAVIILEREFKPHTDKVLSYLKVNTECFSWRLLMSLKTFVLFSIGLVFFRANSLKDSFNILYYGIMNTKITTFNGLVNVGLGERDWIICTIGVIGILAVEIIRTKMDIRTSLLKQNLYFRWAVILTLVFAVILWGQYGPGYDVTEFIYQGF